MAARVGLFGSWAAVGSVGAYGLLYAFSPLGFTLLLLCAAVASALPTLGGSRLPEAFGMLVGPGVLCFLMVPYADHTVVWLIAGSAFVGSAVVGHAVTGRRAWHG